VAKTPREWRSKENVPDHLDRNVGGEGGIQAGTNDENRRMGITPDEVAPLISGSGDLREVREKRKSEPRSVLNFVGLELGRS